MAAEGHRASPSGVESAMCRRGLPQPVDCRHARSLLGERSFGDVSLTAHVLQRGPAAGLAELETTGGGIRRICLCG
jgi:hypothetical protein